MMSTFLTNELMIFLDSRHLVVPCPPPPLFSYLPSWYLLTLLAQESSLPSTTGIPICLFWWQRSTEDLAYQNPTDHSGPTVQILVLSVRKACVWHGGSRFSWLVQNCHGCWNIQSCNTYLWLPSKQVLNQRSCRHGFLETKWHFS